MDTGIHDIILSFNNSPEPIQQAIYYDEVSDLSKKIEEDYGLEEGSALSLENTINLLLLNFLSREELESTLILGLEVEPLIAEGIATTIDEKLLEPLLKKIDLPDEFLEYLVEEIEHGLDITEEAIAAKEAETGVGAEEVETVLEAPETTPTTEPEVLEAEKGTENKPKAATLTPPNPEIPTVSDGTISHVTHVGQSNTGAGPDANPVDDMRIRTMATDMNKARSGFADNTPTYNASSQEDLLNEKKATNNNSPRWDSEK